MNSTHHTTGVTTQLAILHCLKCELLSVRYVYVGLIDSTARVLVLVTLVTSPPILISHNGLIHIPSIGKDNYTFVISLLSVLNSIPTPVSACTEKSPHLIAVVTLYTADTGMGIGSVPLQCSTA